MTSNKYHRFLTKQFPTIDHSDLYFIIVRLWVFPPREYNRKIRNQIIRIRVCEFIRYNRTRIEFELL